MTSAVSLLLLIASAVGTPEIIAHRGESFEAPENTLAAFRLAWERNVPAIELDVHLTQDGEAILCHDKDTKRTTGQKLTIVDTPLEQLRQLDAGHWKDPQYRGEKLPLLVEALRTVPPRGRCFIEIKVGPEALPAVAKAIRESGKRPSQLAIISFQADTVAAAKQQLPEIPAYFLSGFKRDKQTGNWTPSVDELIEKAGRLGADGLDLSHDGPVDREAIRRIKQAGLQFYVWTIDDPARARQFAEWGADGITTNRAAWMEQQLKSASPAAGTKADGP